MTHPFHLVTLIMFISHILLIPFGYYRLFSFVEQNNSKLAGSISAKSRVQKKQQNLVTAKFNFLNWLLEAVSLVLVVAGYNKVTTVVYILLTSSGPPCIYFLGVEEQRRTVRRFLPSRIFKNFKQELWEKKDKVATEQREKEGRELTENILKAREEGRAIKRKQREKIERELREREERTMKERKEGEKNKTVNVMEEMLTAELFTNIDDDSREISDDEAHEALMVSKTLEEREMEARSNFIDTQIVEAAKKRLNTVIEYRSWLDLMDGHGRRFSGNIMSLHDDKYSEFGLEGDSLQITKEDEDEDKAIVIEDDFSFPPPDIQEQI